MDIPEFSIIVPVYKAEKTIHKCLDSILAQTVSDFDNIDFTAPIDWDEVNTVKKE